MEFTDENIVKLFGQEAAEDEDFERLQSYYLKSKTHRSVTADLPLRILVGHKGIGKSAIFTIARHEDEKYNKLSILIRPDDIASVGKESVDFGTLIRDWKDGLMSIIVNKVIEKLGIPFDTAWVNKVGGLIKYLKETFKATIEKHVSLTETNMAVINRFLKESKIIVYIDDLDRGWQSKEQDIRRISALLNAVRDLSNDNKGLQFRISLRTDVYYLVRTSDESTDKIEGSVIWHSWTNNEILLLLVKRILNYQKSTIDVETLKKLEQSALAYYLDPVFERRFQDSGKWRNAPIYRILMSLIRKRPRDLVKLCSLAAKHAYSVDSEKIGTDDLKDIFLEYSQGRMQDTVNEYKSELPEIERLLLNMKPSRSEVKRHVGYVYTTAGIKQKIRNIMERGHFFFRNKKEATDYELLQFMYKINFVTARKTLDDGRIERKYFEENKYLTYHNVDFGYEWEIHPAFRWVLAPDDINKVFEQIDGITQAN